MSIRSLPPAELVAAARAGNRRAIGRLLTLVERGGPTADAITDLTHPHIGGAHVVGITGAPGAGKSTLTGQLTRLLPERGLAPAVLAVDPSSPLSGGAILGDRVRMDGIAGDNVFIRSVATRGHAGGLALSVPGAVRVFDAVGFDPVIIETVGVGQVEVDVVGAADTAVVVVNPGWGDAVQANKAGLLEVADVFVVNKADRAGANDTRRDLELMLDLSHVSGQEDESGYRPPIVMTTATDGNGITEVWDAVQAHREHLDATGKLAARRAARLRYEVQSRVARIIETQIDGVISASVLDPAVSPAIHAAAIADQITSV
ncbi:MAG: methylmalonyl Co-A mutase-associated GTPase MeaB [Acidimicrobiaceae bacterium]|nr:methylmalonyl Co-A mutase-associated GTPase MeaB [Acidimicrobiaceae bacterium]